MEIMDIITEIFGTITLVWLTYMMIIVAILATKTLWEELR